MEFAVVGSGQIDRLARTDLRELWRRAFGDRFSDKDADHAYGGVHVLARDGEPAALPSTGRAKGFYELLGWEHWRGLSYTETAAGVVADGEHGGLMVLRFDASVAPDLSVAVPCEDRPGDAW